MDIVIQLLVVVPLAAIVCGVLLLRFNFGTGIVFAAAACPPSAPSWSIPTSHGTGLPGEPSPDGGFFNGLARLKGGVSVFCDTNDKVEVTGGVAETTSPSQAGQISAESSRSFLGLQAISLERIAYRQLGIINVVTPESLTGEFSCLVMRDSRYEFFWMEAQKEAART